MKEKRERKKKRERGTKKEKIRQKKTIAVGRVSFADVPAVVLAARQPQPERRFVGLEWRPALYELSRAV